MSLLLDALKKAAEAKAKKERLEAEQQASEDQAPALDKNTTELKLEDNPPSEPTATEGNVTEGNVTEGNATEKSQVETIELALIEDNPKLDAQQPIQTSDLSLEPDTADTHTPDPIDEDPIDDITKISLSELDEDAVDFQSESEPLTNADDTSQPLDILEFELGSEVPAAKDNTTANDAEEQTSSSVDSQDNSIFEDRVEDSVELSIVEPPTTDNEKSSTGNISKPQSAALASASTATMTAEDAKKIFTKASIKRLDSNKVYPGIAVTLLIVILLIGLFDYTDESENIDNSLRVLKRDPMKTIPQRPEVKEKQAKILAQVGSTALTDDEVQILVEKVEEVPVTIETDTPPKSTTGSSNAKASTPPKVTKKPANQLQIDSKNTVTAKDRLLKDAYSAYQSGDNNKALQKYNQVLSKHRNNRNALLARAAIHVQNNNNEAAIEDYQTLLLENPKDSLAMSSLISVANLSPIQSETQLKNLLRDEPSSPHLNFALGNIYGLQNRWKEAQTFYFTAFENNASDPNYAYNLAVSLEHINKPKVALIYYQLALTNFSNSVATFNRQIVDQRVEILQ